MQITLPRVLSAALLAASLAAPPAMAQSLTNDFQVRVTIQGTCVALAVSDIDFGNVVPNAGSVNQNTGNIQVQCTTNLPFSVGLNGGQSGDVNARTMVNTSATPPASIAYTLRHTSSSGAIWGDDSGSWYEGTGKGLGAANAVVIPVYAQATLLGTEPAGEYLDFVTATLTF